MPADSVELILLDGWAVTGVSSFAEQRIITDGYAAGAAIAQVPLNIVSSTPRRDAVTRSSRRDAVADRGGRA
jgi:hypothetical protein